MKKKFRWGIIGTGGIANAFAHDIELIEDHQIIAVGSRTKTNAEDKSMAGKTRDWVFCSSIESCLIPEDAPYIRLTSVSS